MVRSFLCVSSCLAFDLLSLKYKHTHRHRQIHCRDHTESTRYRGYMQPNRARRKRGATCRACCVTHLCPPGQICAHRTFVHITTASIQHNSTSRTTQQQRATIHTNTITIRIHAQQHIRTHVLCGVLCQFWDDRQGLSVICF